MNARTLRLALSALVALALATAAWGQEQDAFLERYGIAVDHLRAAVDTMPADAIAARENVDRAFAGLLTLARDTAGSGLVTGMQRVFDRARTAIANGSRDDLAVQVAVLEGAFQRLVYDAALRAALDGDLPLARERLLRVADDVGFTTADRAALADADQPTATLRFLMEVGVAEVMTTRLAVARELAADDAGAAYRALARAYGHFLLVQDSPRTAATLNRTFVDAATALVDGATEALSASIGIVEQEIAAMGVAARERRASVPGGATALAVEPLVLPGIADAEAPEDDADRLAAVFDLSEGVTATDLAAFLFELEELARRESLDALEAELAAAGMAPVELPAHAERLLDAGFETLAEATALLQATSARVVAATHRGEDARAHLELAAVEQAYGRWLSPVVRPADSQLDTATATLFERLREATPLRVQDAVVLTGQVEAVGAAVTGQRGAALQRGAAATTSLWAGMVREVASLVIGLLSLIPLFLLHLAFGGGNRHWQAIGVALFLLWVPALFEGVVGLAGVLATFAGVGVLLPIAAFSVFGSAQAQTVWAATTLLAVVFAIVGLSGISRSFGLLGGGRKQATARSAAGKQTAGRGTEPTAKTIDWDDEG